MYIYVYIYTYIYLDYANCVIRRRSFGWPIKFGTLLACYKTTHDTQVSSLFSAIV